jgi:MerR HTH family regulatory protein
MATVTYTAIEMVERSGVTYRMFDYWRRNGLFGERHRFTGSGRADVGYSDIDLDRLRLLGALSDAGIPALVVVGQQQRRDGSIVTLTPTPAVTVTVDLSEMTGGTT